MQTGGNSSDASAVGVRQYPKGAFVLIICLGCLYFCRGTDIVSMRNFLKKEHLDVFERYSPFVERMPSVYYGSGIIGGILGDFIFGNYRTVCLAFIMTAIGNIALSIITLPTIGDCTKCPDLVIAVGFFLEISFSILLTNIKTITCNQFILPDQRMNLTSFFSIDFVLFEATSVIRFIYRRINYFPHLPYHLWIRSRFRYVIALDLIILVICSGFIYFTLKEHGNEVIRKRRAIDIYKCLCYGVYARLSCFKKRDESEEHWLDYASERYSKQIITESKWTLSLMITVIPFSMFCILYLYQTTSWTIQALRMNHAFVPLGLFTPEGMYIMSILFALILIAIFDFIIYPSMADYYLSLHKIFFGGLLIGISVILCSIVQFEFESVNEKPPDVGEGHLSLYNTLNCNISVYSNKDDFREENIKPLGFVKVQDLRVHNKAHVQIEMTADDCLLNKTRWSGHVICKEEQTTSMIIFQNDKFELEARLLGYDERSEDFVINEHVMLRVVYHIPAPCDISLFVSDLSFNTHLDSNKMVTNIFLLQSYYEHSQLHIDGKFYGNIDMAPGQVHTLIIIKNYINDTYMYNILHNNPLLSDLHATFLLPQIIALTAGEVMFTINFRYFMYDQAPLSLKTMSIAIPQFSMFIRYLWEVLILDQDQMFPDKGSEFILYSGILVILLNGFTLLMVTWYKYREPFNEEDEK